MKRNISIISLFSVMSLVLPGCAGDSTESQDNSAQLRDGMGGLSMRASFANNTPVKQVRYIIRNLDDSTVYQEDVPLNHNLAIPGGVLELEKQPFDAKSKHRFTDLFHHVKPGRYSVRVEPLDKAGNQIDDCYGAATLDTDPMVAREGKVTEKILVIQCHGQDPSALDIIAAVNHEPEGLTITWEKETDDTHSKFTCDNEHIVCLTAHDVDNDPLRFELNLPNAPQGCRAEAIGPFPVNPPKVPCTDIKQCYRVTCDSDVGKLDMEARVYDQAWLNGTKIDIEQWLRTQQKSDAPIESHTKFEFWGYYLTEEDDQCRPCEDCPPDPQVDSLFSYVIVQDLSKSMKDELPAIKQDVADLANTIEGLVEAGLEAQKPSVDFNVFPNGGIASFIDRPCPPFGTPSDYVYKVELETERHTQDRTKATTPAQIINKFDNLSTRNGADSSEAQLQALQAMLGNYDEDKVFTPANGGDPWANDPTNDFYLEFNSVDGRYINVAVVITSSPYHAEPDCKDESKCTQTNNGSPKMGDKEDYPRMSDVAAKLKERQVFPIFLITEEQGDTTNAVRAYTALQAEMGGPDFARVEVYKPGVTKINELVANFVVDIDKLRNP